MDLDQLCVMPLGRPSLEKHCGGFVLDYRGVAILCINCECDWEGRCVS
jgi:hypothetical protein